MKKFTRQFCKLLERNGYCLDRKNGSHFIYTDGTQTVCVNKDLNRLVAQRLTKELKLN